jgi:hypothetical protein
LNPSPTGRCSWTNCAARLTDGRPHLLNAASIPTQALGSSPKQVPLSHAVAGSAHKFTCITGWGGSTAQKPAPEMGFARISSQRDGRNRLLTGARQRPQAGAKMASTQYLQHPRPGAGLSPRRQPSAMLQGFQDACGGCAPSASCGNFNIRPAPSL